MMAQPTEAAQRSPRRQRARRVCTALALLATVAACGTPAATAPAGPSAAAEVNPAGDIPDNQAFVAYTPPSGLFSVTVPEGWARTDADGATTFTDKLNSVRIETLPRPAAPDPTSAARDELPGIAAVAANYTPGQVRTVTRTAGRAVLITYGADSAPDPVTGKVVTDSVERYEFWRAGQEVVLTLSGPTGADNVDPWRIITDSVTWTP